MHVQPGRLHFADQPVLRLRVRVGKGPAGDAALRIDADLA